MGQDGVPESESTGSGRAWKQLPVETEPGLVAAAVTETGTVHQ